MVLGGRRLKSDCRAPRRRATRTLAPLPASVTYGNSSTLPTRNTCARENRFLTTSIGNSSGRGRPGGFKTDASGTRDGRQSPNRSGSRCGRKRWASYSAVRLRRPLAEQSSEAGALGFEIAQKRG